MGRITVGEVKARIAKILEIPCPVELERLRAFFATGSDLSVAEVAKALEAAASGDATKATRQSEGIGKSSFIPPALPRTDHLSPEAAGRADALAFTRAGLLPDNTAKAARNEAKMEMIRNAGVTMVI